MSSETVTLYLGGDPTLDDFATAMNALRQMLVGLARLEKAKKVTWTIDDLEKSSAQVTLRGHAEQIAHVERVTARYLVTGREMLQGEPLPKSLRSSADKLRGVLNGRVPDLRLETADDDVTIATEVKAVPSELIEFPASLGAVEGRIQVLSNRGSLHFTLYDLIHDRPVSCYLESAEHEQMRDAWGQYAIVNGLVKRDSRTGRPTTIRRVQQVELVREGQRGDWRKAEGVLRGLGRDEPAEQTIRRLRDAQ